MANRNRARFRPIGVHSMMKLIKFLRRDELGAAAAEYALILAVVGGGIAVAAGLLGIKINDVLVAVTGLITVPSA